MDGRNVDRAAIQRAPEAKSSPQRWRILPSSATRQASRATSLQHRQKQAKPQEEDRPPQPPAWHSASLRAGTKAQTAKRLRNTPRAVPRIRQSAPQPPILARDTKPAAQLPPDQYRR